MALGLKKTLVLDNACQSPVSWLIGAGPIYRFQGFAESVERLQVQQKRADKPTNKALYPVTPATAVECSAYTKRPAKLSENDGIVEAKERRQSVLVPL
jgi:hypothetical protein